jgi:Fe-S cluster assembly protein SufD
MINNHSLIILGQHAKLSLVQCDDSLQSDKSLCNHVIEVVLNENSKLNYYKMENKDKQSLSMNHIFVRQKANSNFVSNAITFNAGFIRNMIHVNLIEPFADAKLYGLYLVDKKQFVDNQVYVNHMVPDCTSYQMYKGIADDEARANFNGHIVVRPQAQRTSAYQTNKNIALTDEAKITTKPFLEIYADDVKCSHGATIGQLDEEALFYLKSRGICERNARTLLMYAFANEIVNYVEIDSLRERLLEMTQKRLSGELTACSHCAFPCGEEKNFSFKIDLSKI